MKHFNEHYAIYVCITFDLDQDLNKAKFNDLASGLYNIRALIPHLSSYDEMTGTIVFSGIVEDVSYRWLEHEGYYFEDENLIVYTTLMKEADAQSYIVNTVIDSLAFEQRNPQNDWPALDFKQYKCLNDWNQLYNLLNKIQSYRERRKQDLEVARINQEALDAFERSP
jgi:hypothetical protein